MVHISNYILYIYYHTTYYSNVQLDFDGDFKDGGFPFCEPNENKTEKAHKILNKCYNDPNAYRDNVLLPSPLKVTCKDWIVTDEQINHVIKVCKSQLNTIFTSHLEQDKNLLIALVIGYKLHEPYLQ